VIKSTRGGKMSLKPGTQCVIVAGCPENIGLIVEVIGRVAPSASEEDAYWIQTVSGRPFHQLWEGNDLLRGDSNRAITDRYKLRPLSFPKDEIQIADVSESPIRHSEPTASVEGAV
jgi:hypothetical protein